jgi:hypothetical protein
VVVRLHAGKQPLQAVIDVIEKIVVHTPTLAVR